MLKTGMRTWVGSDDVAQRLERHDDALLSVGAGRGRLRRVAVLQRHQRVHVLRLRTQEVEQVETEVLCVLKTTKPPSLNLKIQATTNMRAENHLKWKRRLLVVNTNEHFTNDKFLLMK